jgi:hypothetical protein
VATAQRFAAGDSAQAISRVRWLRTAAVLLLLLFAANQFADEWELFRSGAYSDPSAGDFPHYYLAAKLAGLPGRHRLYYPPSHAKDEVFQKIDPNTEWGELAIQSGIRDTLHFSAPPVVASLLIPLGKLPFRTAFFLWRILCDIFFFLAICVCLQICRSFNAPTVLVCTLAGFAFQPFTLTLEKGQFGSLLLLLWSGGTLLAAKRRDISSALLFALATVLKMTPLLVLGLLLLRRRWKWAVAYVVWMVCLIAFGIWQTGAENQRLYLQEIHSISCGVPGPYNYSLPGLVQNLYYMNIFRFQEMPADTPYGLCLFNKAMAVAIYAAVLLVLWRRRQGYDITWDLIVLSLITLLIAPFTWRHYYVLELLSLFFIWFSIRDGRFRQVKGALWAAIFCTAVAATRYPDYLQNHVNKAFIRVLLVGLLPISALLLLLTILFGYRRDEECP